MVRAFIALAIPEPTRDRIAELIASLGPVAPGVRWLKPDAIHLTLRFLGDSTPEQLEGLRPRLARAAAAAPSAEVPLAGLGVFPSRGAPRVLWLAAPLPEGLVELQSGCEKAAAACGFAPEPRPFRSHVTLGRWRERAPRPALPPADLGLVAIRSLVLYESTLDPKGAIHTPIERFVIGSAGD